MVRAQMEAQEYLAQLRLPGVPAQGGAAAGGGGGALRATTWTPPASPRSPRVVETELIQKQARARSHARPGALRCPDSAPHMPW